MNVMKLLGGLMIGHPILVSLLAPVFSEEAVIFLAILSGRGLLPFPILVTFSFIGILIVDLFWFTLARSSMVHYLWRWKIFSGIYKKAKSFKIAKHRGVPFYILTSKFIYGTRLATVFFLGLHKYSFKKYLIYDVLSTAIWCTIMLSLGWLAGQGFTQILHIARGIEGLISAILVTAILIYVVQRIFKKIFARSRKDKS